MLFPSLRLARLIGASCALAAFFGCGADDREDRGSLPLDTPVAIGATPSVVVGERPGDPDHEFYQVSTPFVTPGGQIAVPLATEGTIRLFDRSGELVRAYGSSGEGPGEFTALTAAWSRGEMIEAFDPRLRRITRFGSGGSSQTIALESVASAQSFAGALRDGGWVLYGVSSIDPSGRDRLAVHHFADDGSHVREITELEGFRRHVFPGGSGPDPISPRPIVRARGQSIFVGETLMSRITEIRLAGEGRTIVWEPNGRVSPEEAIRAARAAAMDSGPSEDLRSRFAAQFDALSGSEAVSVFWDVLVDDQGFLWVRSYDPAKHGAAVGGLAGSGSGGEWLILDQDGNYVTSVALPDDFQLIGVMRDEVIGIRRDEFDVESVRVYPLERNSGL